MILRPKSSPRQQQAMLAASAPAPMAPVPAWLRRSVPDAQGLAGKEIKDLAHTAGTTIGALDAVVRLQERWAGAWRQRLALLAGAVTARQGGRVEDEAALRDAVLLTRSGDDVGPAGRMLLAWRDLTGRPVEESMSATGMVEALQKLGHAPDEVVARELSEELETLCNTGGMVEALIGLIAIVERHHVSSGLGAWLADALLARRLGWTYAVPLLGLEQVGGRKNIGGNLEADVEATKQLLAAQARTALRAIDLSAELGRRADKLLAVAPKLRAKGADGVIEKLLDCDAMTGSAQISGLSDRGLRRVFDRLVELGAVSELSGRSTFRIYGL